MRLRKSLVLLVTLIGATIGLADGPIRLPVAPTVPAPAPKPSGPSTSLTEDEIYPVDCSVECIIRVYPKGLILVEKLEAGTIYAKFAGGTGKNEKRMFKGPFVYVLTPVGRGTANVDIIPVGLKVEADVVGVTLDVNGGTVRPKVDPDPVKPPPVPVDPAPIPEEGLRVLIVYDPNTATSLPGNQQLILYGQYSRDFLDANCVAGPSGKKEWRIYPSNLPLLENESKIWQNAMKLERKSYPWVIVSNGKTGYQGPLPVTPEEFTKLVKKYTN